MTHYDIFRGQLAIKYPSYGHALWEPSPSKLYSSVEVGDVGFIREGQFHRLFNALLSADHPSHKSGVPEHHEPFIPELADHVICSMLSPGHYCSAGVDMVALELDARAFGPGDNPKTSFSCKNRRGGAVLSLPVPAQRQDTISREAFGKWMATHIDRWFAFARQLELGIEKMEELILVTGCDRAKSWSNVTFLKNQLGVQVSFGVEVTHDPEGRISWQVSPEQIRGAVFNQGPGGKSCDLPENQCIFIRGFRVASRSLGVSPKDPRPAAKPSTDTDGNDGDSEPDVEHMSITTVSKYQDPLYFISDYVAGRVPECDMVLVHDDDLALISGIHDSNSLETLQPDIVENYLQGSNAGIHVDLCHISPTKYADTQPVRVAKLLMTSHEPNLSPRPPLALVPLVSENVGPHHTTEWLAGDPPGSKARKDDSGPNPAGLLNTIPHQVIAVDAQAPRPISLLDFPPELMTRILLFLSPFDIISCGRTCRVLHYLCSDSIFHYLIQMERSALSDDMDPGLPYPERLRLLEEREEAWAMLNFRRSVDVPVPFIPTHHWRFTGGALLIGTALDDESWGHAGGHSYITLPSLSDAHDQNLEWKGTNFETEVLQFELAVHEHDLIAVLIAKEDAHSPSERNAILELRLLSFSTRQPHPLAEQPIIFIDKKILPLDRRSSEIEIVGDFLILLVSFFEGSRNQDMFLLVRWKTGLTHWLGIPENGTYDHFTHLSQDTIVISNSIQNALEVVKIVIDSNDVPRFVPLCLLRLPQLIQNTSLHHFYCRAEPKPTGSNSVAIPFPSNRPFHDKAEDAIVIFNIAYDFSMTRRDWLILIVHRRALLSHIPETHRACAPFRCTPEPTPAVVEVPWSAWGPPATRMFLGDPMSVHCIETTAGQRAVMLEDRMPTPIILRDFNPYAVRTARALASASEQSQQGNWSKQLSNGNRMTLNVEDSVLVAGSIFEEDVRSSLPYVEIVTQDVYNYDGVMLDDQRILGFNSNQTTKFVGSSFDVHVLG